MSHQVGKQGDVVVFLKEILGEAVAERVRVDHVGVQSVADGEDFQLLGYAAGGDAFAEAVHEQVAGVAALILDPFLSLFLEFLRDVDTSVFASLSVDVDIPFQDVLDLYLHEFAHAGAGRGKEADDEVPLEVLLFPQAVLEEVVIRVADDVLKVGLLLYADRLELELGLVGILQILVERLDAGVDGLGLEIVKEVGPVGEEFGLAEFFLAFIEVLDSERVRQDGVLGEILRAKP